MAIAVSDLHHWKLFKRHRRPQEDGCRKLSLNPCKRIQPPTAGSYAVGSVFVVERLLRFLPQVL